MKSIRRKSRVQGGVTIVHGTLPVAYCRQYRGGLYALLSKAQNVEDFELPTGNGCRVD